MLLQISRPTMLVPSVHDELRPDIHIRVGQEPCPCHNCGGRAIYQFADQILCRACAMNVQTMLNRLRSKR